MGIEADKAGSVGGFLATNAKSKTETVVENNFRTRHIEKKFFLIQFCKTWILIKIYSRRGVVFYQILFLILFYEVF